MPHHVSSESIYKFIQPGAPKCPSFDDSPEEYILWVLNYTRIKPISNNVSMAAGILNPSLDEVGTTFFDKSLVMLEETLRSHLALISAYDRMLSHISNKNLLDLYIQFFLRDWRTFMEYNRIMMDCMSNTAGLKPTFSFMDTSYQPDKPLTVPDTIKKMVSECIPQVKAPLSDSHQAMGLFCKPLFANLPTVETAPCVTELDDDTQQILHSKCVHERTIKLRLKTLCALKSAKTNYFQLMGSHFQRSGLEICAQKYMASYFNLEALLQKCLDFTIDRELLTSFSSKEKR